MSSPEQLNLMRHAAAAERLHEELLELGVEVLPKPAEDPKPTTPPTTSSAAPDPLEGLAAEVAACRACGLCETRNHTVPGEGDSRARVVFVGEAPGADEDQSGRPFVGAAGQLLTKIINSGMGLRRDEVFICNVLKCRPPGNRDPQPAEKAACTPFLERQLETIRPELVIALGRHAANHLLGRDDSLSSLRGQLHVHTLGFPVLATYHPAYLLRTPSAKTDCWHDIQLGMRHLGMPPPPRTT
ncbi:MAG: uracil-DNA glycosylase [Planctomycetes bacterium]|nr:uracil-DNA glycosylase [Planctomycetota bacterium]